MDPRRLPANIVIEVGGSYSGFHLFRPDNSLLLDEVSPSPAPKREAALVENDHEELNPRNMWYKYQFTIIVVLMQVCTSPFQNNVCLSSQVLFMTLMGFFGEYKGETHPGYVVDPNTMNAMYPS